MSKPKIMKITYNKEIAEESAIVLYRILEKMILDFLPSDPKLIGLFLQDSLNEFKEPDHKEDTEIAEKHKKKYY
ncbi:hypothetical protein [Metabacillus fastidiosus]|uniref:hypothetical protein n=1 Tax=Metabacillus fastidiosus TaxID=1458 RepID=UPI002DBAEF17|nr:hypothetical protein [Metabacillus fastidiosus]MEC2076103.1 hypothetical protein [Metabacillus fastidiosus]